MLKECIASLQEQEYPCDILIVNNASTDATEAYALELQQKDSRVKYYNTGANLGGAGGFNYGMRQAVEAGYEFVWVMDDDCIPRPKALEELLVADKRLAGKYGWLSSVVLWRDGHECKMNRQKIEKCFSSFIEYMQYGIVQAEQATFVSLFLRSKTIIEAGLPIKEFFIWGDDIEYTRRIAVREGRPCFIVGRSIVIHKMQSNNGSNIATDDIARIERYRYAYRNEGYLYRQEGYLGVGYYIAKCGWHLIQILQKSKQKMFYRCWIVLHSMLQSLGFNPDIEYIWIGERHCVALSENNASYEKKK